MTSNHPLLLLSTSDFIPERKITTVIGLVNGSALKSKQMRKDLMAGFKNLFYGDLSLYSKILDEAREEALKKMSAQAQEKGADAIVSIQFSTSPIGNGIVEVYAYGTAVKVGR